MGFYDRLCGNCRFCTYNWSEKEYYCSWYCKVVEPHDAVGCRVFSLR